MKRDPFVAIADPQRRQVIQLLSEGPLSVNQLAAEFDISRPGLSKHLKLMQECGVVQVTESGRERILSLNAMALQEVAIWLANYEQFWDERLHKLAAFLKK